MKTIKKAITLTLGLVMMGAASFAQSLADANKAIDAEQYQKAGSMLKALINSKSDEGENYFYLGQVYLNTDEIDSAKATFTKGITADPKYALNYVGLGSAELRANNASAAKANFDKAISIRSKDYDTYLYIGKSYLDLEKPDFESALPNLQKALELDSKHKNPEIYVALGDYWALQKKNTEAYPQYLAALDLNPNLYRARVQIGKMFQMAQAFPEAQTELKKVIDADPNYGPAYRQLAELLSQWSDFDPKNGQAKKVEGLTAYRKFLDLTDKSFESRYRYAQFLLYAAMAPGATEADWATLDKELATLSVDANNPKSFIVLRMKGYSAIESKNYAAGVQNMEQLFARKQDASRLIGSDYIYLGKAYQNTGKDSLALLNIEKGVELDSTRVSVLSEIARKLYDDKKYDQAARVFKKVVEANSKNPDILTQYVYLGRADYYYYAIANQEKKNPDKAVLVEADSAFAKVIGIVPDYGDAYLFRARIARYMDDAENPKGLAIPFYEQYVQLVTVTKPDMANTAAGKRGLIDAYNNLGFYASNTDKEKAKEYFNKVLALEPTNQTALDNIKYLSQPATPPKKAPIKK